MSTSAPVLLQNFSEILLDTDEDIWSRNLKISFVNEALSLITLLRPDATSVTGQVSLKADTPKQSIPSTGVRLLDIVMNTGGPPIRKIDRESMNETVPSWTTDTTNTAIEHFMFDEENPKAFWVYPVPEWAMSVEMVYSSAPDKFTAASTDLGISDVYLAPVKDYVLYRCYSLEGKGADSGASAKHLSAFHNALGVKLQSDAVLKQVQSD